MSALGYFLESEGVATTGISLVREHTEAMHPPRALWVPFDLGRPLGPPDEPEFQRDVLRALLATLERPSGPVLDELASESLSFEACRTVAPLTLPSHASMLTGLYPPRHGIRDNGYAILPAEATTLAERASGAGLRTAAFVSAVVLTVLALIPPYLTGLLIDDVITPVTDGVRMWAGLASPTRMGPTGMASPIALTS